MVKKTRHKINPDLSGVQNKTDYDIDTDENDSKEVNTEPVIKTELHLRKKPSSRKKTRSKSSKSEPSSVLETIPAEEEKIENDFEDDWREESRKDAFVLGDFLVQDLALEDLFVGAPVSEKEPVFEGKPVFISGEELFEKEPVAEVPIAEDPIEEGDIGAEEVIEEKFFDDEPLNNEENEENEEKNEPEAEKFEIEGASGLEFEPDSSTKPIPDAAQALEPIPPEGDYAATEFASIQAMVSLKGFAPLGMLFVLMDVLGGGEEGLIRVNRLANALKIGKPAMLTQLKNLEAAGLIRTVSSSQRGRHIELLAPNLMAGKKLRNTTGDDLSQPPLVLNVLPEDAPKNFSLEKLKALHSYLTNRGIRVVSLPDESKLDPRLAQIAAYLGKYLAYVQPFYTRLKATLDSAEEIHFSLQGFQGRDVTHTLNFCKMLKDIGFLAAFTYRRAPHYKIVARLNRLPTAINFLSGGWLEHYIRDRVIAILTTHPSTMETPFAFMKNPKIILPGDEDFEFDFLLIVADTVFWIEAKTGEYMDYLTKYARVSKLLGLNRNSNLLVLVDTPKPDVNISARYGLSCCNVDEFAEVFRLALVRELGRSGHS